MKSTPARPYLLPLGFAALSAFSVVGTLLVPVSPHALNPVAVHWRAAASTAPVVLLIGAAILFFSGLQSFKAGRAAFRLLAISLLILSLLLIQVSIWGLFDMWDSAWATSGSGLLPLGVTTALIYVSARKFARALQVQSVFNNWWFVGPLTIAVSVAMGIFAHYYVSYHIDGTDLYIGVCSWGATCLTAATIVMIKVTRSIGASYRRAMHWLVASLAGLSIATWHEAINTLWFNNGMTYTDYGYYLIPWTITGCIMLYASYQFRLLTLYRPAHAEEVTTQATDDDYIDSIVAAAGLASRPEAVDPILDEMRSVTSRLQPGQSLTDDDKHRLLHTFEQLAEYLAKEDPLRTVSRDEVLSSTTPPFQALIDRQSRQ